MNEHNNIQQGTQTHLKPGPAQVGAMSKAQKLQKDFKMSKCLWIGDPFMKKNEKKSRNAKKTERGNFGLVRYCMLRRKPFWFNSLGQREHIGVFLRFCRTFGVEVFWSLQVYQKNFLKIF